MTHKEINLQSRENQNFWTDLVFVDLVARKRAKLLDV